MALDGVTVACITHELNMKICGERISKIAQPEKDELLLTIKKREGTDRLLISANPSLPLITLAADNKPSPATAPGFCMLLRKHIANGKIVSISQPGLERVIDITIEHYNDLGDLCRKHLITELMGKHSNIIFTDEKMMILDSIKHVGANTSSVREVLPGREYFIPQTMQKCDPLTTTEDEFKALIFGKGPGLSKAIYTSYTGISPLMAEEIMFRAGIDSDAQPEELSEDIKHHLYNIFSHAMEDIKANAYHPCIIKNEKNEYVEFAAVPLHIYDDLVCEENDSISEVLKNYYSGKASSTRIKQKSTDLRKITGTLLDRERKKYSLQQKQLKDTEDRDKYRVYGELINTYGYNLEPGAMELICDNYYTGQKVTIPLDENKTIQENSVSYFNKYNKKKRTFDALSELIKATADEIKHLESISTSLDLAASEDDLSDIRREMVDFGYIKKKAGDKGKKITSKSKPYHYISTEGFDIFVGKNNYQNDELTFKLSTGSDWWFHAKEIPGSHVILKSKNGEVTDKAMEEAASLAAYYSSGREGNKVEIDYSLKKNIKKPAGAKPGFVVYYTNYSMTVSPDISNLTEA
ncbi:MAG: NFACT family protein [Lachnospiraceae bacterium]|nr:NFACT family protein [Lachnospiraceae bacterium]